mmetsp:Transcript_15174/g.54607  ORF Transcript_15174/g.54607 Transcript_15174/m.54607 type:complete len:499 (-) Transcript_15174:23-1519(-)
MDRSRGDGRRLPRQPSPRRNHPSSFGSSVGGLLHDHGVHVPRPLHHEILRLDEPLQQERRELEPVRVQQRQVLHELIAEVRESSLRPRVLLLSMRRHPRVFALRPRLVQLSLVRVHVEHVRPTLINARRVRREVVHELRHRRDDRAVELLEAQRFDVVFERVHHLRQTRGAIDHRLSAHRPRAPGRYRPGVWQRLVRVHLRELRDVPRHRPRRGVHRVDRFGVRLAVLLDQVEERLLTLHPAPQRVEVLVVALARPGVLLPRPSLRGAELVPRGLFDLVRIALLHAAVHRVHRGLSEHLALQHAHEGGLRVPRVRRRRSEHRGHHRGLLRARFLLKLHQEELPALDFALLLLAAFLQLSRRRGGAARRGLELSAEGLRLVRRERRSRGARADVRDLVALVRHRLRAAGSRRFRRRFRRRVRFAPLGERHGSSRLARGGRRRARDRRVLPRRARVRGGRGGGRLVVRLIPRGARVHGRERGFGHVRHVDSHCDGRGGVR